MQPRGTEMAIIEAGCDLLSNAVVRVAHMLAEGLLVQRGCRRRG